MKSNKSEMGQFFTTNDKIQSIFNALHDPNKGSVLEPSFGAGDLIKNIIKYKYIIGIEFDKKVVDTLMSNPEHLLKNNICIINGCFFDVIGNIKNRVNSVMSNPPYVAANKYKSYSNGMAKFIKDNEFKGNFNILYLFLLKCAQILEDDGEMIFIVPKDFTYSTYAKPVRDYLENGTFTHWIDCGEEKVFKDADLESLVIFRWVKSSGKIKTKFYSSLVDYDNNIIKKKRAMFFGDNNTLMFSEHRKKDFFPLGDLFEIKVGSVSGCDSIFKTNDKSLLKLKCIKSLTVGKDKKSYFIDTNGYSSIEKMPKILQKYIISNKQRLLKRYGINNDNWWRWSFLRNASVSMTGNGGKRIFVSAKTRKEPFWIGDDSGFAGSVYAMFPKDKSIDLNAVVRYLNGNMCEDLLLSCGIKTNNKFKATPRAIANIPVPRDIL